jgi:hypothetical protein
MQRRMLAVAALASLAVAGLVPVAQGSASKPKVMRGVVFGGVTAVVSDGVRVPSYPVIIKINAAGTRVLRATIGLVLKCGEPPDIDIPDDVTPAKGDVIPIRDGRFSAVQPVERVAGDPAKGTPAYDISARVTGRLNRSHTRITGTWRRKIVIYSPTHPTAATVLDTCDSGALRYTADN